MTLDQWANLATAVGIPLAIFGFTAEKIRQGAERRRAVWSDLDQQYQGFMKLALEHPLLGIYDSDLAKKTELTPAEIVQQAILFDYLISLLEKAFVAYFPKGHFTEAAMLPGVSDLHGWQPYVEFHLRSDDFRKFWAERGYGYSEKFQRYMDVQIKRHEQRLHLHRT